MSKYHGDEKNNTVLKFIRNSAYLGNSSKVLELPNLQKVYELWNAAKKGVVPFLSSGQAQKWFGDSLFTANVKIYMGHKLLYEDILRLFAPDPTRLIVPGPQIASYQPSYTSYSNPELQIERYSSFSTFLWHLVGALDVMIMGLASILFK